MLRRDDESQTAVPAVDQASEQEPLPTKPVDASKVQSEEMNEEVDEGGLFTATLERHPGDRLGLDVLLERSDNGKVCIDIVGGVEVLDEAALLRVERIDPNGLVALWNEKNQARALRPGDRIV